MNPETKRALVAEVVAALEAQRSVVVAAAEASRAGATHEEMRAEDPKDMRSTELSYLARGQALRVAELDEQLGRLRTFAPRAFAADEPLGAGAIVTLESDEGERSVFLLPAGGGVELPARDGLAPTTVISTHSPLGKALVGRGEGDDLDLLLGGKRRDYVVARVR